MEVQSPRKSSREQPVSAITPAVLHIHTCTYTHQTHTHSCAHTDTEPCALVLNTNTDYRGTLLLELWGPGEAGGLPGGGSRFLGLDGGDPRDTLVKTQNSRWEVWLDFWS